MTFTGEDYLLHFALPNFYFHCTTAYDILRHNGLEIGKRDFMRRVGNRAQRLGARNLRRGNRGRQSRLTAGPRLHVFSPSDRGRRQAKSWAPVAIWYCGSSSVG